MVFYDFKNRKSLLFGETKHLLPTLPTQNEESTH